MDCTEYDRLLVAYVKGELPEDDARLVERHIAGCEGCRWNAEAARQSLRIIGEAAEDGPAAELAETLFARAIDERASDIHFQPEIGPDGATRLLVRFRIDGVLRDVMTLPAYVEPPLTARLCIAGEMNPFERRLPQSGRIPFTHEGRDYGLRVSSLPTTRGARTVVRILDARGQILDLGSLGLSELNAKRLTDSIIRPTGIVLIAGPAGSGRTTMLYALLRHMRSDRVSVLTVENPVEIEIPGISQIHVNREVGMGFAAALEALMSQDPDVVMCGDVADAETATALNKIALTGHLVLAGISAADAAAGLKAYMDLSADPLMAGPALNAVCGLRLVRRLCGECAEAVQPSPIEVECLERGGVAALPSEIRRPVGCDRCRGRGYFGRTGIHEVLLVAEDAGEAVSLSRATEAAIRAAVTPDLPASAAAKVAAGITSFAEATRVLGCVPPPAR